MQQTATGQFNANHDGQLTLIDGFSYPLNVNFTFLNENGTDCKCDRLDCFPISKMLHGRVYEL